MFDRRHLQCIFVVNGGKFKKYLVKGVGSLEKINQQTADGNDNASDDARPSFQIQFVLERLD